MEEQVTQHVTIYGKHGCPYTDRARKALPGHTYHDVKKEPDKLKEMLQLSNGRRLVPVIVEGEKVTVGYGGS
jgi:glutaredoxin 3